MKPIHVVLESGLTLGLEAPRGDTPAGPTLVVGSARPGAFRIYVPLTRTEAFRFGEWLQDFFDSE